MAEYLIQDRTLIEIADAIRSKTEKTDAILVSDFANEILNISGTAASAELNFEIVGRVTEPENPTENMIWVNTDVDISEWALSVAAPNNPTSNMIWIAVGTNGDIGFNIFKENYAPCYPVEAYQYIDNVWVSKIAQIYQNGKWISWWDGSIYNFGDECEMYTGGIGLVSGRYSGYGASWGRAEKQGNNIQLTVYRGSYSGSAHSWGLLYTNNKLNLANFSKVSATISISRGAVPYLCVLEDTPRNPNGDGNLIYNVVSQISMSSSGTYDLPLDGIDSGHICVYLFSGENLDTAWSTTVTNINLYK